MLFLQVPLKNEDIGIWDSLVFSIIAILIVFAILAFLVLIIWSTSKIKFKDEPVLAIASGLEFNEDKKLSIDDITDEDMMVAALVATADYVEETKDKDVRMTSIKEIK